MTKLDVLSLLRQAHEPLSGQKIAIELHISRTAVWKAVEALRQDGYQITSRPRQGYRLTGTPERLSEEEIRRHLGTHPWQDRVMVLDSVDSTNNFAKRLAAGGAPEGTAVLARLQTGGRGRLGRSFSSPSDMGIYLSVILRPEANPTQLLHLTAVAAEAAAEAIEAQTGLRAGIKWVNDLTAGGKKLAGILTELSVELESGQAEYVVVGIGVNCCQRPEDFPPELREIATSVRDQTGKMPDRNALAAAMILSLSQLCATLLTEKVQWMQRYAARCVTLGKQVQVIHPLETRQAVALEIDENGALLVEYSDGTKAWVNSGEVSVRGLYGYLK